MARAEIAKVAAEYDPYFFTREFARIQSDPILASALSHLGLIQKYAAKAGGHERKDETAAAVAYLRRHYIMYQGRGTMLIGFRIASDDPNEAAALANELLKVYRESDHTVSVDIVDPAEPAQHPIPQDIPMLAAIGVGVSILFAALAAFLLRLILRTKSSSPAT